MKSILYFILTLFLLSACKSDSNVKTYNIGYKIITKVTTDKNDNLTFDTISITDVKEPLHVLVEKDTIWFNSTTFSLFSVLRNSQFNLYFEPNNELEESFTLKVKAATFQDYYAVLKFGKFFDIKNIKEVYLSILNSIDVSPKNSVEINVQEVKYNLDLEQFK